MPFRFSHCGHWDGHWFVCLDNIYEDVKRGMCLVYSYGIADNLLFEEEMASLGCVVHAYDPTVDVQSEAVKIHQVGLSYFNGKTTIQVNQDNINPILEELEVMTLAEAMAVNGDGDSQVSYLKVDVESHEISAIPEWLQSGVLDNVRQIGLEIHTGSLALDKEERPVVLRQLLICLLEFYKLGFRVVSFNPNYCMNRDQCYDKQFYTFANLVLFKP